MLSAKPIFGGKAKYAKYNFAGVCRNGEEAEIIFAVRGFFL